MYRLLTPLTFFLFFFVTAYSNAQGAHVHVNVGPKAPKLERLAAKELAAQFERLFEAKIDISNKLPKNPQYVILIGSPKTNPVIKAAVGNRWPEMSDQGHQLRSTKYKGRDILIVGGGSPVATLWAVYELGYRFGIRYLLDRDMYPVEPVKMNLKKFDIVMEPNLRLRTWRTVNDFPIGPESWGLAEHKKVLRQLAKMKFNRVMMAFYPWQGYAHYEFNGVKKSTALSWFGYKYRVDGNTAGRAVFRGAKFFENPDLAGLTTYKEKVAACTKLARGIIDTSRDLGMTTAISFSPLEFPIEFAAVLPKAKVLHGLERLTVGPGPAQPPNDPLLIKLVKTQIRAYLKTYPKVDAVYLTMPEFPDWIEHCETAWKRLDARTGAGKTVSLKQLIESARNRKIIASGKRGVQALKGNLAALEFFHTLLADSKLFQRPSGGKVEVNLTQVDPALFPVLKKVIPNDTGVLHFVDYTARRVAQNRTLLAQVPAKSVRSSLIMTLADDNVGMLPQMTTEHVHELVSEIRKRGWDGFSTRYWIIGDLEPSVHYLSRASFDATMTPKASYEELITPMCGKGVAPRLIKGFDMIAQATDVIDKNDIGFTFPVPGVVMKHYNSKQTPPKWWGEVKDLYMKAMNEMYRGNTRARQGGRSFSLYLAKRQMFAFFYMNCIEAVRLAGNAKAKGDKKTQREQLETAVESIYDALDALRDVTRSNCDRGIIAVLNEYGYRPLLRELKAVSD